MEIPAKIGRHEVWVTGEIVGVHWKGPISRDDFVVLRKIFATVIAERGACYLVSDMNECTAFETQARKFLADWGRDGTEKVNGTAVYGVNFAMRSLITLAVKAVKFIGKYEGSEITFVKDEAEAMLYIAARRAAIAAGAPV